MRLDFFNWKRGSDAGKVAGPAPLPRTFDPGTAAFWFAHAKKMADVKHHDIAIECCIVGLVFDPDNLPHHRALLEIAKRRKVAGGRPATMMEKLRTRGKDPLARFLLAEKLWAKEPLNKVLMIAAMERAAEAGREHKELRMGEVADWIGKLLLEQSRYDKVL